MPRPVISLLTDFGLSDHYAGTMKGVMLRICPEVQFVDISHEIPAFAVGEAAYALAQAAPYFPPATVHLVVVDPGVGSARRAIAATAAGQFFVAPDNGVLTMIYDGDPSAKVHEITENSYFSRAASQTFHGRDIFAPVAAHLATGVAISAIGPRIRDFVRLEFLAAARISAGEWNGVVLRVDHFGNVITSLRCESIGPLRSGQFELSAGTGAISEVASAYVDAPRQAPFAICGSSGYLEISVNQGDAAARLGVRPGDAVRLKFRA